MRGARNQAVGASSCGGSVSKNWAASVSPAAIARFKGSMPFLAITFFDMRTFAPIAMSAFVLAPRGRYAFSVRDADYQPVGRIDASPYSAEFTRPAASATVRLAWIWMGDWFMLQTVTKI
jgi:hypothetical protein